MEWLNYHHLLYFWTVAREGGVTRAGEALQLSHPTISGQIRHLERSLGRRLFKKRGRGLELTEDGRLVYRYAEEIFQLGQELLAAVKGRPTGQPQRLVVGAADVVPKLVVRMLLEPLLRSADKLRLVCREDKTERLLAALASFDLDVVFTDTPLSPSTPVRAYNHLLGESEIGWFAVPDLAARLRRGFPRSLEGAPILAPTDNTQLRRTIDQWLDRLGIRARIVAEFEDSALLKAFGQDALGAFPAPLAIERMLRRQFDVERVGRSEGVKERYFAISAERRLHDPAVVAIFEAARRRLPR